MILIYDELQTHVIVRSVRASSKEIKNYIESAERLLSDASIFSVSDKSRFILAYQSIHSIAKMALRACGFKLRGTQDSHVRVIMSLQYTLCIEPDRIQYLQLLREKRNEEQYEGGTEMTEIILDETIKQAEELLEIAKRWLKKNHPHFAIFD